MFAWLTRLWSPIPEPDYRGYRRDVAEEERRGAYTFRAVSQPLTTTEPTPLLSTKGIAGGRISTDGFFYTSPHAPIVLPPPDAEAQWSVAELDVDALDKRPPGQLLEMLTDLSPDVSNALWQWLRMCNPGWTVQALKLGSDTKSDDSNIDPVAQAALDSFLSTLHGLYGTVDILITRLFTSAFLRGALFAELVLGKDARTPVDLATPDPFTVRFRRNTDPERGDFWELCQLQYTGIEPLTRPTVMYLPIDPMPGRPYGRPMASPVLHTALFLMGLLHDLRRVISQQGYPRNDISIDLEALKANMPLDEVNDVDKFLKWASAVVADVQKVFGSLQPDDTYIHSSVVTMNKPVGTLSAEALGSVDGIISGLERMATRALKTQPILSASADNVSDAAANRQWEIYSQGTKTIQHYVEVMLERLLGLALQAQGIPAVVRFRFSVVRGAERFMDAQVQGMVYANARVAYDNGLVNMDGMAKLAGFASADQKKPRVIDPPKGIGSIPKNAVPDPNSNKSVREIPDDGQEEDREGNLDS